MSDLYYLALFTILYFICILIAFIEKCIEESIERKIKKHNKEYVKDLNGNYRIIPLESCYELDEAEKGNNIRFRVNKIINNEMDASGSI